MSATFLDAIWGVGLGVQDLWGEIRSIRQTDGKPEIRQDYVVTGQGGFALAQVLNAKGWDTYFGVLPRTRTQGTADACLPTTTVLWADVDAKAFSGNIADGKQMALYTINAFPIQPQILVDSGGGLHCYWRLDHPVPHAVAKPVMSWIADAINGDHVQDAPRVLRVPGTLNWKRDEPADTRLLRFDLTRLYRFSDFETLPPGRQADRRPIRDRPRIDTLPDWLDELITLGAPQGQRSETCFRAAVWLLRYGRTPDEIRAIFQDSPMGIGAKYAEKSNGDRWLSVTLRAAEAVA